MLYVARDLSIDDGCFVLRRRGVDVSVEPRVLEFIIYLVRHRPRLVSKQELIAQVWRQNHVVGSALTRCACLARKSLGDPSLIRTIHGRGYRWAGPESELPTLDVLASTMGVGNECSQSHGAPPVVAK
jgi:DNA-binding winged helix-turn-helix (wHTH) protein